MVKWWWIVVLGLVVVRPVVAVEVEATDSAVASESALLRQLPDQGERVVETKPDLTETKGEVVGKLEQILREHPLEKVGLTNVLQYLLRRAVERGVPATTMVVVLAFPMVAAVIAMSRHLIGLRGFGIFIPAVLAVAFVASGIGPGLVLFGVILVVATVARMILKWLRLQYLPRMALLLWFVSVGVWGVMVAAPEVGLGSVSAVGIFPVLILILLAESFIEVQMNKSMRTAINLTVETVVLALIAAGVLGLQMVQRLVLLNPELTVVAVAVFDIFVGKYVGLRFKERLRFSQLTEK